MRHLLPLLLLLLPVVLLAGTATDRDWPRVTITPMAAPVLDGTLAPGEWDEAVTLGGFSHLGGTDIIGNQPLVKVAWSAQGLMIGAQV
ncbi:MAG TPA: hypothetical protein VM283_06200, partial [Armatimonadota bacterium]|nr:hypothetical protein [Armatimonadota bacterium]